MYKVINLYLFPLESDVSKYKIESKCNEMKAKGYELIEMKIVGPANVELVFKM